MYMYMNEITIRQATAADKPEWLRLRLALWPDGTVENFTADMDEMLANSRTPVFVASRPDGRLGGFLEAATREYADGCDTSPVGYLEGLYIDDDLRGQGIGGALVHTAEEWARQQGFQEIASDTWLDNEVSIQMHLKLGFEEAERLVHFAKRL